jgi:hypothetical protein
MYASVRIVTARVPARIFFSVVVFLVSAELVALALSYVETGALFYTHRRTFSAPLPTPDNRLVVREAVPLRFSREGYKQWFGCRKLSMFTTRSSDCPVDRKCGAFIAAATLDSPGPWR